MKKIILPTDFSENSWNAIKYALQLFKNESCMFYLLNAYTPVIYNIEYVLVNPAQFGLTDAIREVSLKSLNDIEKRIHEEFKNPNHSFEIISAFNTLVPEIKEIVESKGIDFVIMGTKGATGIKEVLFGSNAVQVIKNVKCPILAVPEKFNFENPHEILFPSDYEVDFKINQIQPIIDIAQAHNARVNVLNVSYGYDLSEEQEQNKRKLESFLKEVVYLLHSVRNQNIDEAITNFQLKSKINLLVMINNKHSFFENLFFKHTINHIGFHLNIPFLVIPSRISLKE